MVVASLALLRSVSAADCPEAASVGDLSGAIRQAETAYAALDVPGFEAATESSRRLLPCLGDVLPPSEAAALHRIEGLSAFIANDPVAAGAAFGAARRLQPAYRLPAEIAPEDNPILDAYRSLDVGSLSYEELPPPPEGSFRLDGQPSRRRPVEVPVVFQWVRPGGGVGASAWLAPGDPLPAYAPVGPPDRGPLGRGLVVAGGSGVAISGLLLGAAAIAHGRYEKSEGAPPQLNSLRSANNGLLVASGVTLVFGVAAGSTGLAVGL